MRAERPEGSTRLFVAPTRGALSQATFAITSDVPDSFADILLFCSDQVINFWIGFNPYVLILVKYASVVHLPGDGTCFAGFRNLVIEVLYSFSADRLGDGHAGRSGGDIDEDLDYEHPH